MFCRYCGSHIADDSVFCAKCGKRLGRRTNPRLEKIVRRLRLNTPYPYALIFILGYALSLVLSRPDPIDYATIKLTMDAEREMDYKDSSLYQQGFSLDLENTGSRIVQGVPVELTAEIDPPKDANIVATYRGLQLPIMEDGVSKPLVVVLTDVVKPGSKRHFALGGSIHADPPFRVTYQIRAEGADTLLASYVVER
jgi:hypothetical protein